MSVETPPAGSVFQRLRPPAALNYLVMTAAGLLVYAMIMLSNGNEAAVVIAILLAVAGVLARWVAAPILVILLTVYVLIDPGFDGIINLITTWSWQSSPNGGGFSIDDIFLAASLLAYTIGHYRLTAIISQSMPEDPTVRRDRDPTKPPRRPAELIPANELPWTLGIAAGCVVVGQLAWYTVVLIDWLGRPNASDLTVGTSRFLLAVWLTGVSLMVVSAALVYLRSNRMTRMEAALSLRDDFFQENRRETDRIQRWRKWYKERVARRRRAGK